MRLVTLAFFHLFLLGIACLASASSVDSVRTIVTPVQCYGLRNGIIHVDTVFGGEKPFFYSLDGQTYTTNPTFDRLWAGTYTLSVRDASGGTKSWSITVKEPAELQVKLVSSEPRVIAGKAFTLRAIPNVEQEFLQEIEWRPPSLFSRQDTLRQTLSIAEPTQFAVFIRDYNNCSATDVLDMDVEKTNVYIPNVIKPGSAQDAYFTVFAGEGVRQVVSMQVYGRGGSLVFERDHFQPNAPLQGWGGRWGGQNVQAGVYSYITIVELLDGKQVRYEGTVTVVY